MARNPTLLCSVIDVNTATVNLTGDNKVLVRYASHAKATMNAIAHDGASIDMDLCLVTNGGQRQKMDWVSAGNWEATFDGAQSDTFMFSAADSAGGYSQKTITAPMVEYIPITCNAKDSRPDGEGKVTLSCSGSYFNGSFGECSNTITAKYRYREKGGSWSGYYTMSVTVLGDSYSASANLTVHDYTASYDFEYTVSDSLMTATGSSMNVTSKPIFHWGESDVAFEVPVSFNAGVDNLKVNEAITVGSANSISDNGGILTVFSLATDFRGGVMQYGKSVSFAEYGTWTPELTCPGVYFSRNGWYTKSGKVVTVGFHIKMTCDSGYNNYTVIISGLPFIPEIAAAGGGMCSGAYVSGGFNFLSFVAETSGNITTRVQSCNHTAAGNLATSASGCWYPSGNSDITLSGTITYITA